MTQINISGSVDKKESCQELIIQQVDHDWYMVSYSFIWN